MALTKRIIQLAGLLITTCILPSEAQDDIVTQLTIAAKRHIPDSQIIELFEAADRSSDPTLNWQMAKAMGDGRLLCLNTVAGQVRRECLVGNHHSSLDQSINGPATEELRQLRLAREFRYLMKAARLGNMDAQFALGVRLEKEAYRLPDGWQSDLSVEEKVPLHWFKAASQAGSAEAALRVAEQMRQQTADNAKKEEAGTLAAAKNAVRPICSALKFSGIGVGQGPWNLEIARRSTDLEDLLASNPLRCAPNALIQTYTCQGAHRFTNQRAYVISWSSSWLQVITPVDLLVGRKDATLFVNRQNIHCLDNIRPSSLPSDNYESFRKTNVQHR